MDIKDELETIFKFLVRLENKGEMYDTYKYMFNEHINYLIDNLFLEQCKYFINEYINGRINQELYENIIKIINKIYEIYYVDDYYIYENMQYINQIIYIFIYYT